MVIKAHFLCNVTARASFFLWWGSAFVAGLRTRTSDIIPGLVEGLGLSSAALVGVGLGLGTEKYFEMSRGQLHYEDRDLLLQLGGSDGELACLLLSFRAQISVSKLYCNCYRTPDPFQPYTLRCTS